MTDDDECFHAKPTKMVDEWLMRHWRGKVVSPELLEETGAPEDVVEYARERRKAVEQWHANAVNRPISFASDSDAVRLFDGPWIPYREFMFPQQLHATIDQRWYAANFRDNYQTAIDRGEIERARTLAKAFYAWRDKKREADEELVRVIFEMEG